MMRVYLSALLLTTFFAATAADVANMSGSWVLNIKRTDWGSYQRPPNGVILEVQHSEPSLKYQGTVNRAGENAPIRFEFAGAIDGKEYPANEDRVDRTIAFKRRSDRVVESVSTLPDGRTKEYSTITISPDGKTLERRIQVREGARVIRQWTEIYEKRK